MEYAWHGFLKHSHFFCNKKGEGGTGNNQVEQCVCSNPSVGLASSTPSTITNHHVLCDKFHFYRWATSLSLDATSSVPTDEPTSKLLQPCSLSMEKSTSKPTLPIYVPTDKPTSESLACLTVVSRLCIGLVKNTTECRTSTALFEVSLKKEDW